MEQDPKQKDTNTQKDTAKGHAGLLPISAAIAHNFVGQWVERRREATNVNARAPMPVARHPSVTTLDARSLHVDVREVLVEA